MLHALQPHNPVPLQGQQAASRQWFVEDDWSMTSRTKSWRLIRRAGWYITYKELPDRYWLFVAHNLSAP
jgi:hypothetical protein